MISGAKLWSQDFGVPVPAGATNGPPEVRKYTLEKANYLRLQLRLYVEVSDASESRVFRVVPIGKAVSFSEPETQLDRNSNLHVLWQSGASYSTYAVVNPDGGLVRQEIYDYVNARPRLGMNDDGTVWWSAACADQRSRCPWSKRRTNCPRRRNLERVHCINWSDEVTSACMDLRIMVARMSAFCWVSPKNDFNFTRTAAIGSPLRSRNGNTIVSTPFSRP